MNPTPTPLASTAMEAAREIATQYFHNTPEEKMVIFSAMLIRHFQPLLAKVEGERDLYRRQWAEGQDIIHKCGSDLAALRADLAAAKEERDALKDWKASAIAVELSWDCQAVGKLIGAPLGSAIRPQIQPAIERLKADLAAKEVALGNAITALESANSTLDAIKRRTPYCGFNPDGQDSEMLGTSSSEAGDEMFRLENALYDARSALASRADKGGAR